MVPCGRDGFQPRRGCVSAAPERVHPKADGQLRAPARRAAALPLECPACRRCLRLHGGSRALAAAGPAAAAHGRTSETTNTARSWRPASCAAAHAAAGDTAARVSLVHRGAVRAGATRRAGAYESGPFSRCRRARATSARATGGCGGEQATAMGGARACARRGQGGARRAVRQGWHSGFMTRGPSASKPQSEPTPEPDCGIKKIMRHTSRDDPESTLSAMTPAVNRRGLGFRLSPVCLTHHDTIQPSQITSRYL
jgi:hypothetical protein